MPRPRITEEEKARRRQEEVAAKEVEDRRLNEAFVQARQQLKSRYQTVTEAARDLEPVLASAKIRDMLSDKPDITVTSQNKRRLVWLFSSEGEPFIYGKIASYVGQVDGAVRDIIGGNRGNYTYFRYWSNPLGTHDRLEYVSGRITILERNGIPVFHHWSHNHESETPEHTGYVFLSDGGLFFLGHRAGTLRLGVARPILDKQIDYMHGLVLSRRASSHKQPFAARFLMVHESNGPLIEKLSNKTPLTKEEKEGLALRMKERDIPGVPAATHGEEVFFTKSENGRYAYYMLA